MWWSQVLEWLRRHSVAHRHGVPAQWNLRDVGHDGVSLAWVHRGNRRLGGQGEARKREGRTDMMNLELVRYAYGADSTLGKLYVDEAFECFILEDERRDVKVPGKTCIPPGRYEILLRNEGPMNERYRDRYDFHEGMLWFQDVENFTYIYFHTGNKEEHTDGCPLTGQMPVILPDGEFEIARSRAAYVPFYKKVVAVLKTERVWIHVREK